MWSTSVLGMKNLSSLIIERTQCVTQNQITAQQLDEPSLISADFN